MIEKFEDKRWKRVDDPDLLNYQHTQLLLIGARKKDVEEELGIDIDEQKETERTATIFKELKIKKEKVSLKPLFKGKFPKKEEIAQVLKKKKKKKDKYLM